MTRYQRQRIKSASARGRAMAKRRWDSDKERRRSLAMIEAEQRPDYILRRIVVIEKEKQVREVVIWSWDSIRSARKKIRSLGL